MQLPKSIKDNLRFLIVEVESQVANLQQFFTSPTATISRRILDRNGYANNLKMRIHNSCLNELTSVNEGGPEMLTFRAVEFVATSLEKIAELSRDCVTQLEQLPGDKYLELKAYSAMCDRVKRGIELTEPAMQKNDIRLALKIGQLERKLDRDYNKLINHHIATLKQKEHTEELTRSLFVARNIKQMGDALIDISESIISANLGQVINLERYQSLQASVEALNVNSDVHIEPIAETRSGCSISAIATTNAKNGHVGIFKDGEKRKLKEERQGVESWHEIYPGLAPKILSFKKKGRSAALLIEHLPGLTFEQVLLHESPELLQETLDKLGTTLKSVWSETHTKQTICAKFMTQLENRLSDVYKIHPEFRNDDSVICGLAMPSFDTLVQRAQVYENELQAPFSVYIHGDFNVDNIIYDPVEKRINFIDLHRSRYMDYVQDVSVFMVSNYRLQILDAPLRRRIMKLAKDFYRVAKRYADKKGDDTFELRLALGLARSFATSTRFILDKSLASSMFLRSRYLIEQVLAHDINKGERFKIPVKEIFVG